ALRRPQARIGARRGEGVLAGEGSFPAGVADALSYALSSTTTGICPLVRQRIDALLPARVLDRMARRYFGTDGVRGVVGDTLTPDLVERLGRAATLWAGARRVFVGRDTRGSGPELEEALVRGIASGGASAILGGVLPTPAVALSGLDLGVVISASHNPPEYNGVKFFDSRGHKLSDAAEEEIEALLDARPAATSGSVEETDEPAGFYVD